LAILSSFYQLVHQVHPWRLKSRWGCR